MPSLKHRSKEKEKLDELNLSGKELEESLRQLAFINKSLGNTRSLAKAVFEEIKQAKLSEVKIIDLGCGGGDILRALEKRLKKMGIGYSLLGIDGNENSLSFAASQLEAKSKISFQTADILAEGFQLPPSDILISSHFMYHFEEEDLIHFIQKHNSSVSTSIIFSELMRNKWAFLLFRTFSRLLGFRQMVKQDGLTAIKRAYTIQELQNLFARFDISAYQIRPKFLFRMIIRINPKSL
ncbi:MAG: methyltransferase domain-containing protein [Bacteroidota bacterium]